MAAEDRIRWNDKYRQGDHTSADPSRLLLHLAPFLPHSGRALELAGGAGRNALWLASRGLETWLTDVSEVALEMAQERARLAGLLLRTWQADLEEEVLPVGPWDLIVVVHFLWRPLFSQFPSALLEGGLLVYIHPTRSNLAKYDRPSSRFLLEDGELPGLVQGLEVLHYEEGWLSEGRHEAVLVARRGVSQ